MFLGSRATIPTRSILLAGAALLGFTFLATGLWGLHPEDRRREATSAVAETVDAAEALSAPVHEGEAKALRLSPWTDQVPPTVPGPDILVVTICSLRSDRTAAGLRDSRGWTENPRRDKPDQSQTPRLDAFAQQSLSLTNAWSNAPFTAAAHAALLTGVLPEHSGVVDLGDRLPAGRPTLPEILSLYGYRTVAYAPVDGPTAASARPEACRSVSAEQPTREVDHQMASFRRGGGFERGFDAFLEGDAGACDPRLIDALTAEPGPFFALVHLKEAHMPYGLDQAAPGSLDARLSAWVTEGRGGPGFGGKDSRLLSALQADAQLAAAFQAAYDAAVRRADRHLGALLDGLAARDRLRSTLVVIVGDHGESLGDNGALGHAGSMQPEVLHVPVVVHLPGDARAGTVIEGPASLVDLPLSLLEAAGATPPAGADGISLLRPLRGAAPWPDHALLAQGRVLREGRHRALHHLFVSGDAGLRFVKLPGGAFTATPLHRGPQGWATDERGDLSSLLGAYRALAGASQPVAPPAALSPAQREALQREGYW